MFVTTTVPPATTAPVGSETVPTISPVGVWDQAAQERIKDRDNTFSATIDLDCMVSDMEPPLAEGCTEIRKMSRADGKLGARHKFSHGSRRGLLSFAPAELHLGTSLSAL